MMRATPRGSFWRSRSLTCQDILWRHSASPIALCLAASLYTSGVFDPLLCSSGMSRCLTCREVLRQQPAEWCHIGAVNEGASREGLCMADTCATSSSGSRDFFDGCDPAYYSLCASMALRVMLASNVASSSRSTSISWVCKGKQMQRSRLLYQFEEMVLCFAMTAHTLDVLTC